MFSRPGKSTSVLYLVFNQKAKSQLATRKTTSKVVLEENSFDLEDRNVMFDSVLEKLKVRSIICKDYIE